MHSHWRLILTCPEGIAMESKVTISLLSVLLAIGVQPALAQHTSVASDEPSHLRRAGVAVGVGNTFGWFGVAGEYFLMNETVSIVAGAGYTPESVEVGGAAFALAGRWYHGHRAHRFFLEGSWSDLSRTTRYDVDLNDFKNTHSYGPGLTGGLQFTAGVGVTLLVAGGAGWDLENSKAIAIMNLGVGYTWRR
jgi:hypothetical protein